MAHEIYSKIPVGTMFFKHGFDIGDEICYLTINFVDNVELFGAIIDYDDGYENLQQVNIAPWHEPETIVDFEFTIEDKKYTLKIIKTEKEYTIILK